MQTILIFAYPQYLNMHFLCVNLNFFNLPAVQIYYLKIFIYLVFLEYFQTFVKGLFVF